MGSPTAEWITAVATGLAFLGAIAAIIDNRRTARRRATFDYIHKIEDLEMTSAFGTMSSFMRGGIRPPRIKTRSWASMSQVRRLEETKTWWGELLSSPAQEDRELLAQICAYPNTLEALASMYNSKLLDRQIVKSHVETQAKAFVKVAEWWLEMLYAASPVHYYDTRVMIKDLEKRKKPRWYGDLPVEEPRG